MSDVTATTPAATDTPPAYEPEKETLFDKGFFIRGGIGIEQANNAYQFDSLTALPPVTYSHEGLSTLLPKTDLFIGAGKHFQLGEKFRISPSVGGYFGFDKLRNADDEATSNDLERNSFTALHYGVEARTAATYDLGVINAIDDSVGLAAGLRVGGWNAVNSNDNTFFAGAYNAHVGDDKFAAPVTSQFRAGIKASYLEIGYARDLGLNPKINRGTIPSYGENYPVIESGPDQIPSTLEQTAGQGSLYAEVDLAAVARDLTKKKK